MNVQFPDVQIPYTSGWTPQSGKYQGTTYPYLLGDGNYIMGDLTLQNDEVLFVSGTANLYVTTASKLQETPRLSSVPRNAGHLHGWADGEFWR